MPTSGSPSACGARAPPPDRRGRKRHGWPGLIGNGDAESLCDAHAEPDADRRRLRRNDRRRGGEGV